MLSESGGFQTFSANFQHFQHFQTYFFWKYVFNNNTTYERPSTKVHHLDIENVKVQFLPSLPKIEPNFVDFPKVALK